MREKRTSFAQEHGARLLLALLQQADIPKPAGPNDAVGVGALALGSATLAHRVVVECGISCEGLGSRAGFGHWT